MMLSLEFPANILNVNKLLSTNDCNRKDLNEQGTK